MKPLMYYWLFMVDFIPYKCISNKYDNGVSESTEYISSTYDERWCNYDVYDVIVTPQTGNTE